MPVKHCCFRGCGNDSRYLAKESGVFFIPFPKKGRTPEKCARWVRLCGREALGWGVENVKKETYICSRHFRGGCGPSEEYPDPVDYEEGVSTSSSATKQPQLSEKDDHTYTRVPLQNIQNLNRSFSTTETATQTNIQDTHGPVTCEVGTQTDPLDVDAVTPVQKTSEVGTQSDTQTGSTDSRRKQFVEHVTANDESSKFYTGLTTSIFMVLYTLVAQKAHRLSYWRGSDTSILNDPNLSGTRHRRPRLLSIKEELLLTLIRLRRGFDSEVLAYLFCIDNSSVSRIFTTWVSFLYHELQFLVSWPSKSQVKSCLPKSFKHFPNTRVIIDCTEFFIQKPSLTSSQRVTWSHYKHHNTLKSLVGISPSGTFIFLSKLFTGSISDRRIVQDSGFLNNLEYGDDVMADRGFLIRDLVTKKFATLNIPPFSMGKKMSSKAVT